MGWLNNPEWRKGAIEAIDETIKKHKIAIRWIYYKPGKCPLCKFNESFGYYESCSACPWVVLENTVCSEDLYLDHKASIERLNKWKQRIMEVDK